MLWLTTAALAAPTFIGANPDDIEVAERAWALATECNGREALAADVVEIVEDNIQRLGNAEVSAVEGLTRIVLLPQAPSPTPGLAGVLPPEQIPGSTAWIAARRRATVAHEVAHAWAWGGPEALDEGRAALLVDCMRSIDPSLAPVWKDDGERLVVMPDLLAWKNQDGAPYNETTDAYRGARRLMMMISAVAPEVVSWPHTDMSWHDLHTLLSAHGAAGEMLWTEITLDLHSLVAGVWPHLREE